MEPFPNCFSICANAKLRLPEPARRPCGFLILLWGGPRPPILFQTGLNHPRPKRIKSEFVRNSVEMRQKRTAEKEMKSFQPQRSLQEWPGKDRANLREWRVNRKSPHQTKAAVRSNFFASALFDGPSLAFLGNLLISPAYSAISAFGKGWRPIY